MLANRILGFAFFAARHSLQFVPMTYQMQQFWADDLFQEFWQVYPRKVAKRAAEKAYEKALRSAHHDDIMFGLSQQLPALEAKEKQYIPHAATWLNGERWLDEPEQITNADDRHADAANRQINVAARAARSPNKDCF